MEQTAVIPVVERTRRVRTIRVGLAGCGVVGAELVRLLEAQDGAIHAETGLRFDVVRVLVRRPEHPRGVPLAADRFTSSLDEFLAADVDLVVEATNGVDTARRVAETALRRGLRFVSANKALVAAHGPALSRLARRHGGRLDFESAVGGGIPVVRALRDSLARSGVLSVRGILNGTTNYILSRLAEGAAYATALAEAQSLGFAEADPSRDVEGEDAADKIAILAWLAFGVEPAALPIRRRGIVPHPDRLAADAVAFGGVPRLVAECALLHQGVTGVVEPVIVPADSELGRTRREQNAVLVESRWNATVRLAGPGAGGAPTAAVLLADMVRGARPIPTHPAVARATTPDLRDHHWAISALGTGGPGHGLVAELDRAGIEAVRLFRSDGVTRVLTEPVPWPRVERVERALAEAGLEPVIARFEPESGG